MSKKFYLHENWKIKLWGNTVKDTSISRKKLAKWIPAKVPGTVHTDLFNAGLIDNPFKEGNEYKYEWISRSSWIYRMEFDYPAGLSRSSVVNLVFEGIDTSSEIFLNNKLIGRTGNMFLKSEFNVDQVLKPGKNVLELFIDSPVAAAKKNEEKYGSLSEELNSYRVHIRKAQYSFGWDWGPSYPASGIWRSVYLAAVNKAALRSISFNTEKLKGKKAKVKVGFEASLFGKERMKAVISLSRESVSFTKEVIAINQKKHNVIFEVENPDLWWPNGLGEQNLYDLSIRITDDDGNVLDEKNSKVGIRKIVLELKDKENDTFRFRINNKLIYIKGMNWIPADSFLPRVSEKKYAELLTLARDANANMIRVWGGGIYENDEFYDLCDRLGLLIWQDFMFACADYPENEEFLNSVREEVSQNVERLRTHPCIAIWCGNNENEWIWYRNGNNSYKEMPGYNIFHKIIPGLMKDLDPHTSYWPTSPFGSDEDPNSQASGNRHQWNIWSNWIDYPNVEYDRSLFVTEFGFQGPACIDTFNKILPAEKRKIQDAGFEYYNKQVEGPERVIRFLAAHLPLKTEWEDFIYLAQLSQGLALKTCLEHWRANRKITNGSIIWQLNDCWPVTSWSLIDSEIMPKISYYFVKNAFCETVVLIGKSGDEIKIRVLNEGEKKAAVLNTQIIDPQNGKVLYSKSKKITIERSKYIGVEKINTAKFPEAKNLIIISTLTDQDENIIHRNFYTIKEWKHISAADPGIKVSFPQSSGSDYITLTAARPAFFVDVYHPGTVFSEKGFILLPGEKKNLKIIKGNRRISNENIRIFCLNNYLEN